MAVVVTLCALRGVVGVALGLFGQVVGMALRALGCMLGVAPGLLGCVLRPAGQLRCLTLLARDLLHRPFADAASVQADEALVRDVLRLVQDLAEEHVGSRLRSLSFLLSTWS